MTLSRADVSEAVDRRHWRLLLNRLHTTVLSGTFVRGLELVSRIAEAAERAGHHPDVDLRYPVVHVSLVSHDVNRVTERDLSLAAEISALIDEAGLTAEPRAPQALEIAVDALDIAVVVPFWRAVLGYADEPVPPGEEWSPALVDPSGLNPSVWFQQMDSPRPQRNRVHLDVTVPDDEAESRVAAAVAAGGHLVSDARAPSFWVLADAEGNEACVCTWQARD